MSEPQDRDSVEVFGTNPDGADINAPDWDDDNHDRPPIPALLTGDTSGHLDVACRSDMTSLDIGEDAAPPIQTATDEVNWAAFLSALRHAQTTASTAKEIRNKFSELPGVRIRWRRVSETRFQLIGEAGGDSLADIDKPLGIVRSVHVAGKGYRAHRRPGRGRRLYDASTGTEVFAIRGRHVDYKSGTSVHFADGRVLRFPVHGQGPATAVMAAVDSSGQCVMAFRRVWPRSDTIHSGGWLRKARVVTNPTDIEVAINPAWAPTDDLLLLIVVASKFLDDVFRCKNSGGG